MTNDISITVKVSDEGGPGLAAIAASLQALKEEAAGASQSLVDLRAAAHDIRLTAELTDQATPGLEAVQRSVQELKAESPVHIAVTSDGDSAQINAVRGAVQELKGESPVHISMTFDGDSTQIADLRQSLHELKSESPVHISMTFDGNGTQIAEMRRAVQELKDESPVLLNVTFDGDSTRIADAAQAMRDLRTNAAAANTSLSTTATRGEAAATALTSLKSQAQDAGNSLRTLRGRAAAAAESLGDLRTNALAAAVALRTLNTRTGTAGTRMGDLSTNTRTLRTDMDDLDGALTRVGGNMTGLRGSLGTLGSSSDGAGDGMSHLAGAALTLAPALIPIASSLAPIVVSTAAAGAAVGVLGVALLGQIKGLGDAATAQQKYEDTVAKSGAESKKAVQAQDAARLAMSKLPPATQQAAAALMVAKDAYKSWSDELAGTTMPVATKGMALFTGLLGKISPLVKTSAGELQRMETILAGGMQSPGFDHFVDTVDKLAAGALQKTTTGLLRLGEAISSGKANGPLAEFMAYAKANGPAVGDTLKNLGEALVHLISSASDVGVSMLTVVNVLSKLVSAVPPAALTDILQLAIALKTVKLAAAGMAAVSGGMTAAATAVGAMRTAAAGAAGPMAGLTAAIASLSTGAKVALAGTGIGLLVVALGALSTASGSAPPNVDKLTTSLENLATTGKVSGEAARAFGNDLSTLGDSLRVLARPSNSIGIQQWMTQLIGMDSTPVKKAKQDLDAVDKSLASLVSNGHADIAAAAFKDIAAAMEKQGLSASDLRGKLDNYKQALADQAFEQKMAAQSMGLFGDQALAVQQKLDAQKQSTDGLRQSIQALNDVQRAGLSGMIGFEAAIDAAAKAAKDNAGQLHMVGGQLDLTNEKSRNAATALNELAAKTDEAASSARDSGQSWSAVNAIYDRGREKLLASAQAMGLTRAQAQALAAQIMSTPDKTARLRGNLEDLQAKLNSAKSQLAHVPDSRRAAILAQIADLQRKVEQAKAALNSVNDKSVTITTHYRSDGENFLGASGRYAHGGIIGAAGGGPRSRMTLVGEHGPELVDLAPGSRVHSNPDTARMLSGGGDGGVMQLEIKSGGSPLDDLLVEILRKAVRVRGGNVQLVLGQG